MDWNGFRSSVGFARVKRKLSDPSLHHAGEDDDDGEGVLMNVHHHDENDHHDEDGEGDGGQGDGVPSCDKGLGDHVANQNINSWLDKLVSPAAILTATLAASIVITVGMWYFPSKFEKSDRYAFDMSEAGRVFQDSKFVYGANIAVVFSVIYPFFDLSLDTIRLYLYKLSEISNPANVFELKNNSYMICDNCFLAERWMIVMYSIIAPSIILIYMDPSRDPSTLVHILLGNIHFLPFLANGCLLSIFRESLKSCTTKITILIWISRLLLTFVYIWSNSITLRAITSVLTMLTMSYPLFLTFMERYNKNKHNVASPSGSDEIYNKNFELHYIVVYSLMVLFSVVKDFASIVPSTVLEDGSYNLSKFIRMGFATAFATPIFVLLLCSPKKLYRQWQEEKIKVLYKHSVQLLECLLPRKVIAHFRHSKEPFVESFDSVTILFVDIMDYTVVCRLLTPYQIVLLLGDIFRRFDKAAIARGVYRVETIGDCYMASTGCPDADDPSVAAEKMVLFAQDVIKIIRNIQPPVDLGFPLQIRVGVHSGPITAGTLSGKMPKYCLFGDTVNTAARMESTGEVGRIHLSADTVSLVRKGALGSYDFQSRLPMHVKGKGVMSTYFLDTPEDVYTVDVYHGVSSPRRISFDSGSDEPEPHLLLKNFFMPFAFMGQTRTERDDNIRVKENNYDQCPHYLSKPFAAIMPSKSTSEERTGLVAPVIEDPELIPMIDSVNEERRMVPTIVPSNANPMASVTISEERRILVVLSKEEDDEASVHMVATPNPKPSAPMGMAFVAASSLLSWDFDVQNIISKDMLIDISFTLFQTSWLCGPLGVSELTLRNFIENVAESYHHRSFHNLQHAVSVLHVTSLLMYQKHIMRHGTLTLLARFALMVGALVHDCDHPGHSNAFEVNTKSSLAQKYGNDAVLENHHLAVAESVLSKPGCNILESFDEEKAMQFRDLLKYIVLGTDMSVHKEIVSDINKFITEVDPTSSACMFTLSRAILHAADLSNPVRGFDICKAWAIRLAEEHTKQVQAEEALGLTPAQFMVHKDTLSVYQGEIGFLTDFAQPLWEAMAKTWPQLNNLNEQLQLNIQKYQDLVIKASEDELRIATQSSV